MMSNWWYSCCYKCCRPCHHSMSTSTCCHWNYRIYNL